MSTLQLRPIARLLAGPPLLTRRRIGRIGRIGAPTPRLSLAVMLGALVLCACKPARPAPPEPPPSAVPVPRDPPGAASEPVVAAAPAPEADAGRCKCPSEPAVVVLPDPAESDADNDSDSDDEAFKARRARASKRLPKPLAARLRGELPDHRPVCDVTASGPCSIRGDFDGDGRRDDAVLVRSALHAGGIAILWASGGSDLLGGGRHQCWTTTEQADLDGSAIPAPCVEPIDADLDWVAGWQLLAREVKDGSPVLLRRPGRAPGKHGHPAPGALGDALLLDGGDAAAALYRTASGWTLMHLGY